MPNKRQMQYDTDTTTSHDKKLVLSGVREIAEVMGISPSQAYAIIKRPDFPAARLGKRIVVVWDSLKKWLDNGGTEQRSA